MYTINQLVNKLENINKISDIITDQKMVTI